MRVPHRLVCLFAGDPRFQSLPAGARQVWITLADRARSREAPAQVSIFGAADMLEVTDDEVEQHVRALVDAGLLMRLPADSVARRRAAPCRRSAAR
jgi:hypothetical protein